MRPKFIITIIVIVSAFAIALLTFKFFTNNDGFLKADKSEETTQVSEEIILNQPLDPMNPDLVGPNPMNPDPLYPDPLNPDPMNPDPLNPDPMNPDPMNPDMPVPGDQEETPTEEYDYSSPEGVFEDIENIKDEYTGRPDYIYNKVSVEMAKNFGIYETGKQNPFSEIYSLEDYNYDKSVIIPNESN